MAVQSNDTHQYGVAKLASKFAGEFGRRRGTGLL